MSDLISRQAVLALPRNKVRSLRTGEVIEETINVTDIENLPPAQPKIIRCKDCKNWDNDWGCDRCGEIVTDCSADMRGEGEKDG